MIKRKERSLHRHRAPGESGVEYELDVYPRKLVISSPAVNEVYVTVGCHLVHLTAEEAAAIAVDLAAVAAKATRPA